MVKGVGIDIIEIYRINKILLNNREKFLKRILSNNEIEYISNNNFMVNTIAGNFAAKEAVLKALGIGLRNMKITDIEVLRDNLGKPYVVLKNSAKAIAKEKDIKEILISISHSKEHAIAQAIAI